MTTNRLLLLGPPGTGKTTRLLSEMQTRIESGVPASRIAFISFTRSAVRDARRLVTEPPFSRSLDELNYMRTLHSLCFYGLSLRKSDVFGREALSYLAEITGEELTGKMDLEAPTLGERGDALLFLDQLSRSTLTSLRDTWRAHDTPLDWYRLKRFTDAYATMKRDLGLLDFTDMLERYVAEGQPIDVDVALCDEAQDFTPLQWKVIERAFGSIKELIISGDDDQCQPAGTMVETLTGAKPIEDLDEEKDRLIYYSRIDGMIMGHQWGSTFNRASRLYTGKLYTLETETKKTSCTKDHKWYVKWTEEFKRGNSHVVYLMQKDNWFRVGHCKTFVNESLFHVGQRANCERADKVWILKVLPDRRSAYAYEQIVAVNFGLPQTPFYPVNGKLQAVLLGIDTIQEVFNGVDSYTAGMKTLMAFGLLYDQPFINKRKENYSRYGSTIMEVVTCNLLDGAMEVPVYDRSKRGNISWEVFRLKNEEVVNLPVFSLKVHERPAYVADGIGTHNCIYNWAGASSKDLTAWPYTREVLHQSYRLPKKIWELALQVASRITQRWVKTFLPTSEEGRIEWLGRPDEVDLSSGSWLLLARTRRQLNNLIHIARDQGVVHSIMGRSVVSPDHVRLIQDYERERRGDPSVPMWHDALTTIPLDEREFLLSCLRRGESLTREPRVRIETIHGAKGLEASNVLLLTDLNARIQRGMELDPDAENRVLYVALTRARESLFLVVPQRHGFGYQL